MTSSLLDDDSKGLMEGSTTCLTGKELLEVVKKNSDSAKEVLPELAGQYTTDSKGKKSFQLIDFYTALLEAQWLDLAGMKPASSGGSGGQGGRELPFQTKVMKHGPVLLGVWYLRQYGFPVGSKFKVQTKDGAIRLVAIREQKK